MGFPLRTNIFRPGPQREYFARFPIQVAVLYRPEDRGFAAAFRDLFLQLDQITGDEVAFFAVLDPPNDWKQHAQNRTWWRDYRAQVAASGMDMNDGPLLREIARLFSVPWDAMPRLVAARSLWSGEWVTASTGEGAIERQLLTLTQLARRWGEPEIGHIQDALNAATGLESDLAGSGSSTVTQLSYFYDALDAGHDPRARYSADHLRPSHRRSGERDGAPAPGPPGWDRIEGVVVEAYSSAQRLLSAGRRLGGLQDSEDPEEALAEEVAGRLVAPASVAMKVMAQWEQPEEQRRLEMLDSESTAMIAQSFRIGHLLEMGEDGPLASAFDRPWLRSRHHDRGIDFTPGVVGMCKAFEKELNLSLLQAARKVRGVPMPERFALWDPTLPAERGRVQTGAARRGRQRWVDINLRERHPRGSWLHHFWPLGDLWHVTNSLRENAAEGMEALLVDCLGGPLPDGLMRDWLTISRIRNRGFHQNMLSHAEYSEIFLRSQGNLGPILQVKARMKGYQ